MGFFDRPNGRPTNGSSRLAQAAGALQKEAQDTVGAYDALLARVALVSDADARGEILKWIGRADVPGSPAERYKQVRDAIASGTLADPLFRDRLTNLEDQTNELKGKVENAEATYGTLSAPVGTDSGSGRGDMTMLCVAGGIALLGLIVVPLLFD